MADPRQQAGAIDLGALKDAQNPQPHNDSGFEPYITATQQNLDTEVLRRSLQIPVIVHFGSQRSPGSIQLGTALRDLATGQRKFRVAYVDVDSTPSVAQAFGVRAVPTVVALAGGRPVSTFEGNQPTEQLKTWVDTLVEKIGSQLEGLPAEEGLEDGSARDPRLDDAEAALSRNDFDSATSLYDAILADDPKNAEVAHARATVDVLKRLDPANRNSDPIAEADKNPDNIPKQLDAADAEVVAGVPEKAFARLLALVKTAPEAKARLLELFGLFQPSDPRVIHARTQLASALF